MAMTDIFLAVEAALKPEERTRILSRVPPSLRGAAVADVLDEAYDCDWGLAFCEPYFDRAGAVLAVELVSDTLQRPTTRSLVWVCALAVDLMLPKPERDSLTALDAAVAQLARAAVPRLLANRTKPAQSAAETAR